MTEQMVLNDAILGGALGGLASFMLVAYNNFKTIPTLLEAEIAKQSLRKTYLLLRLAFGIVSALICSFWFMDDVMNGTLSKNRFVFYSSIIGFSTTLLPTISSLFIKIYIKIIAKFGG